MRHLLLCGLLGLYLTAGCAGPNRQQAFYDHLNRQIGVMTITDAIQAFGPPRYERRDANGETLMVWEQRRGGSATVHATPNASMTNYHERRDIWTGLFGADGRLRHWTHRQQ